MRVLTLHQPWASLVALGVKTIETRGWSTPYRGPLAIHAGKQGDLVRDMGPWRWQRSTRCLWRVEPNGASICTTYVPAGAIVATCTLFDVVPMVPRVQQAREHLHDGRQRLFVDNDQLWLTNRAEGPSPWSAGTGGAPIRLDDQLPFGDYRPGRWAWLLSDVTPLDEPVPWKGAQGLRELPRHLAEQLGDHG